MTSRVVVVGAGIAGVSVAGALRAAGHEGEIVLLGEEPELPYRRPPVSKEVVRGAKTADDIRIKKADWYDAQRITLRTGTLVAAIDVDAHEVRLDDDEVLGYDTLVLATGGRARTIQSDARGVRTLRGLADVEGVVRGLTPGAHVVVVGAGLIGSEIAASARGLGAEVSLLETADLPLPRLLPPLLGRMYVDLHEAEGTDLHTGVTVTSIEDGPDGRCVVTAADGRTWTAPLVVVAIGMAPCTELAEAAGITVASAEEGGGVVVDEHGLTSAPDVYAVGDVAQMPNDVLGGRHRVEHWQNAQNHGTAVGRNIAGEPAGFHEVPWAWSDQYGHTLQVAGWPSADHRVVVRGSLDERDFSAFFLAEDGVLRGAVTIGRPGDVRKACAWIAARERPSADRLADESLGMDAILQP